MLRSASTFTESTGFLDQALAVALLRAAHAFFCASLIFFRAFADIRLLPLPGFLPLCPLPCNAVMAVSSRSRSASSSAMIP